MSNKSGSLEDDCLIKVAIIGYGSIAKVHSKILNKLGARIVALSCSTLETGEIAANEVYNLYGYKPYVSINIGDIVNFSKPNCIFICTPPEQHFKDIIKALDYEIPIFCEKPLIWNNKFTKDEIRNNLEIIKYFKHRKLFCNFANNNLLISLIKKAQIDNEVKSFKFIFYTQGSYQNREIAVDLLPHGIAMLTYLLGFNGKINNYIEKSGSFKFQCNFQFNNTEVEFEFAQSKTYVKKFQIQLNERLFERKIKQENGIYQVWFEEKDTNNTYKMKNPFEVEVSKFLRFVKENLLNGEEDNFMKAYHNTKILSDILLNK